MQQLFSVLYTIFCVMQTRWGLGLPTFLRPVQDLPTFRRVCALQIQQHWTFFNIFTAILRREAVVRIQRGFMQDDHRANPHLSQVPTHARWLQGRAMYRIHALPRRHRHEVVQTGYHRHGSVLWIFPVGVRATQLVLLLASKYQNDK